MYMRIGRIALVVSLLAVITLALPVGRPLLSLAGTLAHDTPSSSVGPATLVKDINTSMPSPAPDSSPDQFITIGRVTYFVARDDANGAELWKSDGTAAGTVLVKDINPGPPSSVPYGLTNVNGTLFFVVHKDYISSANRSSGRATARPPVRCWSRVDLTILLSPG